MEKDINLFKITICKDCFYKLSNISVEDKEYERYKNLVRIILSYYIGPRPKFYPVN